MTDLPNFPSEQEVGECYLDMFNKLHDRVDYLKNDVGLEPLAGFERGVGALETVPAAAALRPGRSAAMAAIL